MNRRLRKGFSLFLFYLYSRFAALFFKIDNEKILFLTESHESLDGNLKVMYEYLVNRGKTPTYYTKCDRRHAMRVGDFLCLIKDISTARYIFLDDFYGLISAMKVRKEQNIVQLWHGAGAFKKFGFSRLTTGDGTRNIHGGYRKYTHAIVSSDDIRQCYAEAFDISIDKVYATGIPRTDCFFDNSYVNKAREAFYKKFRELENKKIVLVAPTYRGDKVEDANYDFEKLNLHKLIDDLGDEYAVCVKWHRAINNNITNGKIQFNLPEKCYDFNKFEDINDLLIVADILVTDYSSVIFDYSLLNKPIVYFTYDLDDYCKKRGLYFDFSEYIFGNVAIDARSLVLAIKKADLCNSKRAKFLKKFMGSCEGKSSKKLYDQIF